MSQRGQTLIETMVAVFMLVMGVSAAVGLAIFAFNSSTSVLKQIVATGLAREGIEAVKNMRDTNWLKDTISNSCYDFQNGANDAKCYTHWLTPNGGAGVGKGYDISQPPGNKHLRLVIDLSHTDGDYWNTRSDNASKWGLDFDPTLSNCSSDNICGFYTIPKSKMNQGISDGTSDYYRKIIITEDNAAPYDKTNLQRLKVQSLVWWTDKKCPRAQDWSAASPSCRVEIDSNLTNWKDY